VVNYAGYQVLAPLALSPVPPPNNTAPLALSPVPPPNNAAPPALSPVPPPNNTAPPALSPVPPPNNTALPTVLPTVLPFLCSFQGACTSLRFDYIAEAAYMSAQRDGPSALRALPLRTPSQRVADVKRAKKLRVSEEQLPLKHHQDDGVAGEWALLLSQRRHGRPVYYRRDHKAEEMTTPLDKPAANAQAPLADGPLGHGYLYLYSTDGSHWGIGACVCLLMLLGGRKAKLRIRVFRFCSRPPPRVQSETNLSFPLHTQFVLLHTPSQALFLIRHHVFLRPKPCW
jgi:hypothetical protein